MANIPQTQNFYGTDGTAVAVPPPPPPQQRRGSPPARRAAQPASDPNMLQTDVPADPLSPVTLILNYLKSRGYQPSAENIRRTVEANARDPGVLGADPVAGLRNARPSTEAEDQAAMRAAGVGGGRSSGGGDSGLVREEGSWDVPGGKTSSAPATTPSALPTPAMMPRIIEPITDVSPAVRLGGGGGGGGNPAIEPPPTTPIADSVTKALEGPPEPLALPAPPMPRLPSPSAMPNPGVPVPEPAPVPALAPPAPPPPPNITTSPTLRTPAVPTPPPVPPPSTFGSRALENFRAGGGVRGAVRGFTRGEGEGPGVVGRMGGVGNVGTLGAAILDSYLRNR